MRRIAAWLVAVPMMFAGTEVAHALAYRIVYPVSVVRWQVLATTGHGYFDWFPLLLGIGGAAVLLGAVSDVFDAARGRAPRSLPAWAFGLLPVTGFALQEFLERSIVTSSFAWWTVLQPTFRVGLLLQVPFGLAIYALTRLLLRAARGLAAIFAGGIAPVSVLFASLPAWPRSFMPVRVWALSRGWSERGPPLLPV